MKARVRMPFRITKSVAVLVGGSSVLLANSVLGAEEAGDSLSLLRQLSGIDPEGVQVAVRVFLLVTVFSVVPSIVLLATCFPRILILLLFLRRALGTQDLLPGPVVTGLAFVLTAMVMMPVFREIHDKAYVPLQNGSLDSLEEALVIAEKPVKAFMLRHTRRKDLRLMDELSRRTAEGARPEANQAAGRHSVGARPVVEDLGISVVLPAFVLSELKTAFQMGFLLYLPFLVIDLMVSAVLLSMGMFMLPPVLVSLPLKVLVFVLVDGWHLVVGQLVQGFQ